jgi:hypothetical protein
MLSVRFTIVARSFCTTLSSTACPAAIASVSPELTVRSRPGSTAEAGFESQSIAYAPAPARPRASIAVAFALNGVLKLPEPLAPAVTTERTVGTPAAIDRRLAGTTGKGT